MRAKELSLLCVCLFVGGLFFVAASPAAAQIHCSQCACTDPCSTTCFYLERYNTPEGPVFEQVETTCGAWGNTCAEECTPPDPCTPVGCTSNIYGTSANNTINGTSLNECIWGYDGNDTIDGNAGRDWIYGGNGTDTIYGDSGNDCLYGQGGNDHLDGESGSDDVADGQGGTDTCTAETELNCEL